MLTKRLEVFYEGSDIHFLRVSRSLRSPTAPRVVVDEGEMALQRSECMFVNSGAHAPAWTEPLPTTLYRSFSPFLLNMCSPGEMFIRSSF
jgi:hypothetical protein